MEGVDVRVLVASDSIGSLSSSQAGRAIGSGWSAADVRVLPVGDSGAGFASAYADLLNADLEAAVDGELLVTTAFSGGTAVAHVSAGTSGRDRKSTRLNSSHANISYAVFCL